VAAPSWAQFRGKGIGMGFSESGSEKMEPNLVPSKHLVGGWEKTRSGGASQREGRQAPPTAPGCCRGRARECWAIVGPRRRRTFPVFRTRRGGDFMGCLGWGIKTRTSIRICAALPLRRGKKGEPGKALVMQTKERGWGSGLIKKWPEPAKSWVENFYEKSEKMEAGHPP